MQESAIHKPQLILIGASVRAAAFSASRAGLRPWCLDLFADEDLRRCCPAAKIAADSYPDGFRAALDQAPPGLPWMYTGGIENHADLVHELTRVRPLWGNGAAVLKRVRDPRLVTNAFQRCGVACPDVIMSGGPSALERGWLRKPLASAAGLGIRVWPHDSGESTGPKECFFQRFIPGPSYAAVYLADRTAVHLLGVTRQLVGEPWLHAGPFRYCGSVGPVELPLPVRSAFRQIGEVLADEFGLRGLFGVDAVLDRNIPYPVEVNPRYPASVEVLEFATGIAALALHRSAFDRDSPPVPARATEHRRMLVAKGIWFAATSLSFPGAGPWQENCPSACDVWRRPAFADIPPAQSHIESGHPVLTIFTEGADEQECLSRLRAAAAALDETLAGEQGIS